MFVCMCLLVCEYVCVCVCCNGETSSMMYEQCILMYADV